MSYLEKYGSKKRMFQAGGAMVEEQPPMEAAPGQEGQASQEEMIIQLAEAAVGGDQNAAMELGMLMAPMLLEQVQAAGGAPGMEAAPAEQPVFRKGGKFVGVARKR